MRSGPRRGLGSIAPHLAGIVVAALLGVALAGPFFLPRHDDVAALRGMRLRPLYSHDMGTHFVIMKEFDKVLRSGVIYPRWLPDLNKGYGAAWTSFYPPGVYYVTSALHCIFSDWTVTLFALCILSFAGSIASFYYAGRALGASRIAGAVGALVYALVPYHLLDLYWRGALPELGSFVLLPLIFLAAYRVAVIGRARDLALLGLVYSLQALLEIPVCFLLSFFLVIFAGAIAIRQRAAAPLLRIAAGVGVGLMIASFYLLPAIVEQKLAYEPDSGFFPYSSGYVDLKTIPDPFLDFSNPIPFLDALHQSFSVLAISVAVLTLLSVALKRGKTAPSVGSEAHAHRLGWAVYSGMAALALFLCTSYSDVLAKHLPRIDVAGFPWRWMSIASVFLAFLLAECIDAAMTPRSDLSRMWLARGALVGVVALNGWIGLHAVLGGAMSKRVLAPDATIDNSDFTPIDSARAEFLPDTPLAVALPQAAVATVAVWQPQYRKVVIAADRAVSLRLRTYDFPGWAALVDGQSAGISRDRDGILTIQINPGRHQVEVFFGLTPVRRLGLAVSIAGLLLLLGLCLVTITCRARLGRRRS